MSTRDPRDAELEREERAIYIVIAIATLPLVIGAALRGGVIGGGATFGIGILLVAISRIVARARVASRRLPRARIRPGRRR